MLEPCAVFQANFEGHAVRQEAGHKSGTWDESGRVGGGVVPAAPSVENALTIIAA